MMKYKPHPHITEKVPVLGQYAIIDDSAEIDMCRGVRVGEHTVICREVLIMGHEHVPNYEYQLRMYTVGNPMMAVYPTRGLCIAHHCWIGVRVIILPQVEYIAPYTIIGAGSVVTKDINQERCIWVGNPAVAMRKHDLWRLI